MKKFLCCVVKSTKKENKNILQISPDTKLDTFGKLHTDKQEQISRTSDKTKGCTPQSKKAKTNTEETHKSEIPQRHTIAIQAGSPLSKSRKRKTKTTLMFAGDTHEGAKQNSSKSKAGNILNPLKVKGRHDPFGKSNVNKKGDIILPPIDVSLPKKLVPVDKEFLQRLERETAHEFDRDENTKTKSKPTKREGKTTKIDHTEPKEKTITTQIEKSAHVNDTVTESSESDCFDGSSKDLSLKKDCTATKTDRCDISQPNESGHEECQLVEDGIYDKDEINLMEEIEKEFCKL